MEKSQGQLLVEKLEKWFAGYLHTVSPDLPLVLALWAIGSHVMLRFYSWPYLVVTAATKGAGKSRVLELLKPVVLNGFKGVSPSPAFVLRELRKTAQRFTLLWDEAEASASSDGKSFFSEVMNSGNRKGDEIGRALGSDDTVRYPAYCAKAFALIGDVTGTIDERSIRAEMVRGNAAREFDYEVVAAESAAIHSAVTDFLATMPDGPLRAAPPAAFDARDREVWGAMFGLAAWLGLDAKTMKRLHRYAAADVVAKKGPRRRITQGESAEIAIEAAYAERALKDLASVFRDGEVAVPSVEVVRRMMEIDLGPWRAFKGKGLDPISLAGLVLRFGLEPAVIQFKAASGKRADRVSARAYRRVDVSKALGR